MTTLQELINDLMIFCTPLEDADSDMRDLILFKKQAVKLMNKVYLVGKEDEKKRIDTAITEQFKYAAEHDNYDMRGVDWKLLIHEDLKQSIIK